MHRRSRPPLPAASGSSAQHHAPKSIATSHLDRRYVSCASSTKPAAGGAVQQALGKVAGTARSWRRELRQHGPRLPAQPPRARGVGVLINGYLEPARRSLSGRVNEAVLSRFGAAPASTEAAPSHRLGRDVLREYVLPELSPTWCSMDYAADGAQTRTCRLARGARGLRNDDPTSGHPREASLSRLPTRPTSS